MTRLREFLVDASTAAVRALGDCDIEAIDRATQLLASRRGGIVFTAGNGGSAATASHFAADLGKAAGNADRRFRAMCLNDNVPALTAWANDEGWESPYWSPLATWLRAEDTLVVFSVNGGSGFSGNLMLAAGHAHGSRAAVITFSGVADCPLAQFSDVVVALPEVPQPLLTPLAEGLQSVLAHLVIWGLREGLESAS